MRRIALLLTAAIATVALLAFFYPSMMVNAADVATRVEGENFDEKPTGTSVVTNTTLYAPPNGQALKYSNNTATAIERAVIFGSQGDVVLWAREGQSGGSPILSVNVDGGAFSASQPITNSGAPVAYTYVLNVAAGSHTIGVRAGNTGTGRNPFVDFVTFPASGSGGTDPGGDRDADGISDASDNCPDVYNPGQRDDDKDGVGNKCDDGSTTPQCSDTLDNDNDGKIDYPADLGCSSSSDNDETNPTGGAMVKLVGAGDIAGSNASATAKLVKDRLDANPTALAF